LEKRDNIINSLQEKLIKVESEYQNVESLVAECHEQEQCQHNINHNWLIHNDSRSNLPNTQADDSNINMQNQENSENLHLSITKKLSKLKLFLIRINRPLHGRLTPDLKIRSS
jgi:hypothetical protein